MVRSKLAETTAASIRAKFQEPSEFSKEAQKAFQDRRENLAQAVAAEIDRTAVPDDVLWPFLKQIQAVIIAANPQCAGTKIILTGNPQPNAYSVGDGTIVIYTGLLAGLENEDQLAFVLCHEMAHFLLEHATNGLVKEIKTYYSKEFKDKVKAASAVEFNQYEQLENIYKSTIFHTRYHRRDLERQADSLAYRMFLKTDYAPVQAQRLMQIFEYIDEPLRDSALQVENHFGCSLYPFKSHWVEKAQASVWGEAQTLQKTADQVLRDSMSTHPDWQNRLLWIDNMLRSTADTLKPARPESLYAPIKRLSILEAVDAWFDAERYDRTLYYALLYQQQYPDCAYLREIQTLSLNGLYFHAKEHTLADVLAQNSPDYPDKYNQFLDFLNNLRLKDLLALEECSWLALPVKTSEYSLLATYCLAMGKEDSKNMQAAKKYYLSTYPRGRFVDFFK